MKHRIKIIIAVLSMTTVLPAIAQTENSKKPVVLPIAEAIEKKLLEFEISGASDPRTFNEVVDRNGDHFGKCMAIVMKSNIDSVILVKIDCGTELIPQDSTFQTMIVTKTVELPLYPRQTYATRFYAMCGQIHDAPPFLGSLYEVGGMADSNTVKLAQYFDKQFMQNMIGQHALWAYTDKADFKELEKYGADSLTIAMTTKILDDLSIKTNLNKGKNGKDTLPDNAINNTITINIIIVYIAAGILILLLITTSYLLLRKSKNLKVHT
jgi:hypothetical protein